MRKWTETTSQWAQEEGVVTSEQVESMTNDSLNYVQSVTASYPVRVPGHEACEAVYQIWRMLCSIIVDQQTQSNWLGATSFYYLLAILQWQRNIPKCGNGHFIATLNWEEQWFLLKIYRDSSEHIYTAFCHCFHSCFVVFTMPLRCLSRCLR